MTDFTDKLLVTLAVFVFLFGFGLQGFHSHRMPQAQAQARSDLGPDTTLDGPIESSAQ